MGGGKQVEVINVKKTQLLLMCKKRRAWELEHVKMRGIGL